MASLLAGGCSFLVESRGQQCQRDEDCSRVEGAVCDVAGGVCVPRGETTSSTASTGTGDPCVGPNGCYACEPERPVEFLDACTDAQCITYDNNQLRDLLLEDGSLPPVP